MAEQTWFEKMLADMEGDPEYECEKSLIYLQEEFIKAGERIIELTEQLGDADDVNLRLKMEFTAAMQETDKRIKELEAALEKANSDLVYWGQHSANCLGDISGRPCTCGLNDAKDQALKGG